MRSYGKSEIFFLERSGGVEREKEKIEKKTRSLATTLMNVCMGGIMTSFASPYLTVNLEEQQDARHLQITRVFELLINNIASSVVLASSLQSRGIV